MGRRGGDARPSRRRRWRDRPPRSPASSAPPRSPAARRRGRPPGAAAPARPRPAAPPRRARPRPSRGWLRRSARSRPAARRRAPGRERSASRRRAHGRSSAFPRWHPGSTAARAGADFRPGRPERQADAGATWAPRTPSGFRTARAASPPRPACCAPGALVAFPTETVYGLGADARQRPRGGGDLRRQGPAGVQPADRARRRPRRRRARWPTSRRRRARSPARFWPGPLTLVLPRRPGAGIAELATAGLPTVALRIPSHPLARRLLAAFGGPVAAPSANPSGRVSATTAAHVLDGLGGRIAAVLDGGACPVGVEFDHRRLRGRRPGAAPPRRRRARGDRGTRSAGRSRRHPRRGHRPGTARLALRARRGAPARRRRPRGRRGLARLRRRRTPPGVPGSTSRPRGDLAEAAANLFAHLRAMDALAAAAGAARIAVAPIPRDGLGRAINDRLARAAAPRR